MLGDDVIGMELFVEIVEPVPGNDVEFSPDVGQELTLDVQVPAAEDVGPGVLDSFAKAEGVDVVKLELRDEAAVVSV